MRYRSSLLFLALAVLEGEVVVPCAMGQESVDVEWSRVCETAHGRPMRLTTSAGDTVEGFCMQINVREILVQTPDHGVVKIARAAMSRIVLPPPQHQLQALGSGMRKSWKTGFRALFTPAGPAAVVMIAGTLAWGTAAAPFCVVGDLFAKKGTETEIRTH